ncbi:hypothetical protein AB0F81_28530 [Actinoplanes sp. NPDC024001]|uniref:hypothetical protein n=1 Tax=Actinoplanes sp. NPDC024001 TaxID=3154598 RepID=UPI00340B5464
MMSQQSLFGHGDGAARDPAARISSATRYLSGAAYLDEWYAAAVVDRFVADRRRAVPPSLGYDLTTVIRHCLRARRLWLAQNAVVTAILLLGLVVFTAATATLVVAGLGWALILSAPAAYRRWAILAGLALMAGALALYYRYAPEPGSGVTVFVGGVLVVVVAVLAALTWSRYRMIMTIAGEPEGPAVSRVEEVEQRLRVIDTAQHGNILLHAGYDPFVGAGETVGAWSLATELKPVEDREPLLNGSGRPVGVRYVPIDPVELVGHLRRRLAGLRSRDLPEHERITGLQLRDLVVSPGARWLIDEGCGVPYSHAAPEAVESVIRAPRPEGRHFLRASVGAAECQGAVVSTFVHVAVEGGMLYVEVVCAVLAPIRRRYREIDAYDRGDRRAMALREAAIRLMPAVGLAPLRLVRALGRAAALRRGRPHECGAPWDVRELAARTGFANYLQRLDAEKYRRLIDRRATEAIYEFLSASGVGATELATGAAAPIVSQRAAAITRVNAS